MTTKPPPRPVPQRTKKEQQQASIERAKEWRKSGGQHNTTGLKSWSPYQWVVVIVLVWIAWNIELEVDTFLADALEAGLNGRPIRR